MSDNNISHPPYRASQAPNPRQPLTATKTFAHVFVGSLLALALSAVWTSAGIKANLLAASRPERILVRIPTAVRVPGPIRVVQPACPAVPSCSESVRSIDMERWALSDALLCAGNGTLHTTIRDHYVVVECRCPEVVHSPAAR